LVAAGTADSANGSSVSGAADAGVVAVKNLDKLHWQLLKVSIVLVTD
jgi:hypothetical protein